MRGLLAFAFVVYFAAVTFGSSHSEAPGTASIPPADGTDLYVFRSYETGRSQHMVVLANFYPMQNPFGGPNYFSLSDQHVYDIYIDTNGDGVEDKTFRFTYGHRYGGPIEETVVEVDDVCNQNIVEQTVTANVGIALNISGVIQEIALKYAGQITATNQNALNWHEYYTISYINNGTRDSNFAQLITETGSGNTVFTKPFDYVGTKTFPNYAAYANQYIYNITIPDCSNTGRVFVGQRKESFQINLGPIFDLINFIPIPGFPGAIQPNKNNNNLANKNIATFALELPIECMIDAEGNGVVGVWQATLQLYHDDAGNHVVGKQVQRLANPLVNEILVGLPDKGKYNRGAPVNDSNIVVSYIEYPTFPQIVSNLFLGAVNQVLSLNLTGLAPTKFPRNDLRFVFLEGIPGINQMQIVEGFEMIRFNTSTPVTPPELQKSLGVLGGDLAGFPNGRRPGDDTVDIGLDALMGALCWLNISCTPADAPVGYVLFTDGVPTSVYDYDLTFPFLKIPIPGSGGSPTPTPTPLFPYTPIFTPAPVISCPPTDSSSSFSWVLPVTLFLMMTPLLGFIFSS